MPTADRLSLSLFPLDLSERTAPYVEAPALRTCRLPLGALAAGFGCLALPAWAEPVVAPPAVSASAPVVKFERVTVMGQIETDADSLRAKTTTIGKGNQALRDIPQSVTVVTEKLIEDRRIDTLKEALHQTAGVTF